MILIFNYSGHNCTFKRNMIFPFWEKHSMICKENNEIFCPDWRTQRSQPSLLLHSRKNLLASLRYLTKFPFTRITRPIMWNRPCWEFRDRQEAEAKRQEERPAMELLYTTVGLDYMVTLASSMENVDGELVISFSFYISPLRETADQRWRAKPHKGKIADRVTTASLQLSFSLALSLLFRFPLVFRLFIHLALLPRVSCVHVNLLDRRRWERNSVQDISRHCHRLLLMLIYHYK